MLARSSPGRALVALATCHALACDAEVAWPDAGPHAQVVVQDLAPRGGSLVGGTILVIDGRGFAEADAEEPIVLIGDRAATDVHVADDFTISAIAPAGTAGATVDVVVANRNGIGRLAGGFRYHPRPTVASVRPTGGASAGGTGVTITGTGFQANLAGVARVRFGDLDATDVVVVSDTLVTARTPPGPPFDLVDVSIDNANGDAAPALAAYAYSGHGLVYGGPRGGQAQALHFVDLDTGVSSRVMIFDRDPLRSNPIHALATIAPGRYWAVTRGLASPSQLVMIDLLARTTTAVGRVAHATTGASVECHDLDLIDGALRCMQHDQTYALDPATAVATPLAPAAERVFGIATTTTGSFAIVSRCCTSTLLASFDPASGAVGAPLEVLGAAPALGKLTDLDGQLYAIDVAGGGLDAGPAGVGGGGQRAIYRIDPATRVATVAGFLPVRTMSLTRSE